MEGGDLGQEFWQVGKTSTCGKMATASRYIENALL